MDIYKQILEKASKGKKQLCVLLDPDKLTHADTQNITFVAQDAGIDCFFIGGSLFTSDKIDETIISVKERSTIPVVIFPGNVLQISSHADAILFLSLISGRNAEMLIGKHVIAAPYIREAGMEVIPTGYMLVDGGKQTAVSYMSNSLPIPYDKNDIAMCTALAGEMLGLKLIYMDAGSGAEKNISLSMVEKVKTNIKIPLVIGGGICDAYTAKDIFNAGADILVIGNAVENNSSLIYDIMQIIK
ncbi:MAG: geranylgeranylglyceryl/heptaprenylglyceryl phosphate synthase [Bacteroidales bacterium]|jgi:putative glycerol-1-phosphate prenyltransferase|nr:geranylgeranylglyceryl/heptaprenylglyceryl phosphate synthase [Bacteroidales bacterium]MDD4215002.1 geranylgeranylglyceryl/heptaprenylglyceryl phosphate synthase [Bacteroidales bacterium]